MINSVTEIRDRYQNPNPYPPRRPIIHRLYDTWGGTREGERTKVKKCGKTSIVAKNIFECCIQLFSELVAGYDLLIITICQPTQQSYLIFKNVVFVKLQK